MGLAASQARFLCLTARKADCEFKSTDLAQQKLNITRQLADISNTYANAMNATKLMWSNEAVSADFGLSYGVLMSPSALNDYNSYMVTTQSGAIVLNSQYARAARAAGISRAGGIGSQEQRDKFIAALAGEGLVTKSTADNITKYDYDYTDNKIDTSKEISVSNGLDWDPYAGLGGSVNNKSSAVMCELADIILSEAIGQQLIDWGTLVQEGTQHQYSITKVEYDKEIVAYENLNQDIVNQTASDRLLAKLKNMKTDLEAGRKLAWDGTKVYYATPTEDDKKQIETLDKLILQLELIKNPKKVLSDADLATLGITTTTDGGYKYGESTSEDLSALINLYNNENVDSIFNSIKTLVNKDKTNFETVYDATHTGAILDIKDITQTSNNDYLFNANNQFGGGFNIVQNGVIVSSYDTMKELTIGDILTSNIVFVSDVGDGTWKDGNGFEIKNTNAESAANLQARITRLFNSLIESFGYSSTKDLSGTGLNVDDISNEALEFAYNMTMKQFKRVENSGTKAGNSVTDNSAYDNAVNMNAIGMDSSSHYGAVSLTNMLASFLTYYDNYLRGEDSEYVVGRSAETSVYVTDNPDYVFAADLSPEEELSNDEKIADFFDQLYNNILVHGWKEDVAIDEPEYLESLIKNGRYSLSSLNYDDGYYYQTRYNDTGYIVEVSDTDAIARAEAEFASKKAELTYKEDSIDLKTKQLDTEISSITQEIESAKNLISKGIEKAFSLFQQ
ncbi:MAG: hypothetical protein E7Z87_05320 [Cyanobacteria bacterium SIG26]|nr:hypothetical protein [Cyanobacteria bacterium SIG26]